jgi:ATP/maltotriose-dependent transcriptional regulator MalT
MGWGHALSGDIHAADAWLAKLTAELTEQRVLVDRFADGRIDSMVTGPAPSPGGSWSAEESLLRAYLASCHANPATMIAAGRRAMNAPMGTRTRDANQLAPILVMRGLLWSGKTAEALSLRESLRDLPFVNDMLRESNLSGLTATLEAVNGQVRAARRRVDAAMDWFARANLDPLVLGRLPVPQAEALVLLEGGLPREAIGLAQRVQGEAERSNNIGEAIWAMGTIARAQLALGDSGAALRTLSQARANAVEQTPGSAMSVVLDQIQALAHVAAGDTLRAERLIRALPPSDQRSLLWARLGVVRQPTLSRRALDSIGPSGPRVEAEKNLLLAAVHRRTSRRMAQGHLRRAAEIAQQHGLALLLIPALPGIPELAQETALEDQDDNLRWLLDGQRPKAPEVDRPSASVPNLSRGELQLIDLLPTRARNADIAQTLGVSINTVKTRLRRLYGKLGAANRDEAITRARERGLLE